jgi:HAD superfamily hydrolase (TIGR01490 family)
MYVGLPAHDMTKQVAAYFDLDGTLLDASSEKSLASTLSKRRPWRIPLSISAWSLRFIGSLATGKSVYDSARNRGHFTMASWESLDKISLELVANKLSKRVSPQARQRLDWHREQGHRLVLVTATVLPMAEAMANELAMDCVYGCGPENRQGRLSGSEKGWSVPRRKGKVPIVEKDAQQNDHDLSQCWAYGNTLADSWFMKLCGNPVAVNPETPLRKLAEQNEWTIYSWKV